MNELEPYRPVPELPALTNDLSLSVAISDHGDAGNLWPYDAVTPIRWTQSNAGS